MPLPGLGFVQRRREEEFVKMSLPWGLNGKMSIHFDSESYDAIFLISILGLFPTFKTCHIWNDPTLSYCRTQRHFYFFSFCLPIVSAARNVQPGLTKLPQVIKMSRFVC